MRSLHAITVATAMVAFGDAPLSQPPPAHVDLPLGEISCDRVAIQSPLRRDATEDERLAPNHCLVRLFSFPSLAPLDLPLESVELRGAVGGRRVGSGEYLFEQIPISYTSVAVHRLASEPAVDPPIQQPSTRPGRRRPEPIASRNPLVLARHATTLCDLYVAESMPPEATVDLHGIVIDRLTAKPIEGATVRCGDGASAVIATTGADGHYRFPAPLPWNLVLDGTLVEKPDFNPSGISRQRLLSIWVDRFHHDGVAAFVLFPADRARLRSPLLPALTR